MQKEILTKKSRRRRKSEDPNVLIRLRAQTQIKNIGGKQQTRLIIVTSTLDQGGW